MLDYLKRKAAVEAMIDEELVEVEMVVLED